MTIPIYVVDAFSDVPFAGNPAAVCILPEAADAGWMQSIAAEMNLSETAFLSREGDGFRLRWFTPTVEVDLCGHATLASAHILWQINNLGPDEQARFYTRSGLLTATRAGAWIELDFPAKPETAADAPDGLIGALGVRPIYIGKNQFDYLVEVETEADVRGLSPDYRALRTLPARGIMVTSRASTPGYDFVSRFFAPGSGIDEDPVTGSAHCCLAPYWQAKLGKNEFVVYQASQRGGILRLRVNGERVAIGGQAFTVLRGELNER